MRTISKLSAIVLIVFFLFFSVSCSDEEETDIIGAHTISGGNLPFQATAVSFNDTDFDEDQISGSLLITKATDESLVDEYRVYWGSSATEKLSGQEAIATISADGNDQTHSFAANTAVPTGATHFLVYSASSSDLEAPPVALDIPDACIKLVKDIRPGTDGSGIGNVAVMNGALYFTAESVSNNRELWKSDGTESGTIKINTFNTSGLNPPQRLTVDGNTLYFVATNDSNRRELWKSNGTAAGTEQLTDFNLSDPGFPVFGNLAVMNGEIFFPFDGMDTAGTELWKSSGTFTDQTRVTDIIVGSESSISDPLMATMNSKLYFLASDNSSNNKELWSTDGITSNESLVLDIDGSNSQSSEPRNLTVMNGFLYFSADDNNAGDNRELWKTDGTTTSMVTEINPGNSSADPQNFLAAGSTLYFTATDGTNGFEPWKSDGTPGGTEMVFDINPGGGSASAGNFTEFSGRIFFKAASDGSSTTSELWETDGTDAGTNLVKVIATGVTDSFPAGLTVFGNHLFFFAADASSNKELWRSDGTEGGTIPVTNFAGDINSGDGMIQTAGDKLLFTATNTTVGQELFVFYYK